MADKTVTLSERGWLLLSLLAADHGLSERAMLEKLIRERLVDELREEVPATSGRE